MKACLRKEVRNKLASVPTASKEAQGALITAKVLSLPAYSKAKRVAVYLHARGEVPTSDILHHALASGKECYAPKVLDPVVMDFFPVFSAKDLETFPRNKWGIAEPTISPTRKGVLSSPVLFDMILIPGVAFDHQNARLGKGKGYYDRFLKDYLQQVKLFGAVKPVLIGLAFKEQMVDKVPTEAHDMVLDTVITP